MKKTRKLLSVLLVLCMLATFVPAAFAADSTEPVFVYAEGAGQKAEQEVNNVTVSAEGDATGVYAGASNGAEAAVAANGNVSATANNGGGEYPAVATAAEAYADAKGTAEATVSGNAAASSTDANKADAYGAVSQADGEGTTSVAVSGDASATSSAAEFAYACGVQAIAYGGTAEAAVSGNASAKATSDTEGNASGAMARANNGGTATATVSGNASAAGTGQISGVTVEVSDWTEDGALVPANGTAEMTVSGNAAATSTDDYATGLSEFAEGSGATVTATVSGDATASSEVGAYAVDAYVLDGGTATATVGGNATATSKDGFASGVTATTSDGATASMTVGGDVSATGSWAEGVYAYADGGTTTVEVGGDVSAAGNGYAIGVSMVAGGEGAATTVSVGGSVEASGEGSRGAMINTCENATSTLAVSGDVTGEESGLYLYSYDGGKNATTDILVEGTVKGGETSIRVASLGQENVVTLTVWKAEVNSAGEVVGTNDYNAYKEMVKDDPEALASVEKMEKEIKESAKKVEEAILYIIKYENPENGTISLAGTVKSHDLDAATEGTTVTLKALAKDGYKMVGAFNGTDTKTSLMKDANGDYYIVVPKGGGVFLTVKMEKIQAPADNTAAYDYVPVQEAKEGAVTVTADAVETTQGYDVDISDSESAAELKAALLTNDEQNEVAGGKDVKVVVEYKPATVSAADEKKVQDEIGSAKIATWLNVSVFKQVEGAEKVQVEKPNGKITLQIVAPDDIIALAADGTLFEVVSIVNGKVVRIPAVYNAKTRTIDFETDFFGVFALVYGE